MEQSIKKVTNWLALKSTIEQKVVAFVGIERLFCSKIEPTNLLSHRGDRSNRDEKI